MIKEDLIGKKISNIYYSENLPYEQNKEAYFVLVENETFLMLSRHGINEVLRENLPKDLRPINPNGITLNRTDYVGCCVDGVNVSGPNGGKYLSLNNGLKVGVRNMWFEQSLYFGPTRWKPNAKFYQQEICDL